MTIHPLQARLDADKPTYEHDDFYRECLMTRDEFLSSVACGGFIDYDGYGEPATETHRGKVEIYPSQIKAGLKLPEWATHVCWYNK